jgi:hypothetical protein
MKKSVASLVGVFNQQCGVLLRIQFRAFRGKRDRRDLERTIKLPVGPD